MLKSRVINEGAQTDLFTIGGTRDWRGRQWEMTAGTYWSQVRSGVIALDTNAWKGARMGGIGRGCMGPGVDSLRGRGCGRLRPFIKAQMRWAQTHGNGRGRVEPGADSRCEHVGPRVDRWDRVRTVGTDV
jgi:hypothetical protein